MSPHSSFLGGRQVTNSLGSVQSALRQRDQGDVALQRGAPNAVGGSEQAPQRRGHPPEPCDNHTAWDGFSRHPGVLRLLWTSALGGLPALEGPSSPPGASSAEFAEIPSFAVSLPHSFCPSSQQGLVEKRTILKRSETKSSNEKIEKAPGTSSLVTCPAASGAQVEAQVAVQVWISV